MSDFIPDEPKEPAEVPYFDDVKTEDGWQGHTTTKSLDTLKSEIVQAVSRLGGTVTGFQKGRFTIGAKARQGYRVLYTIDSGDGRLLPGRIDIAALPVKEVDSNRYSSYEKRQEKSLKMALYMLRNGFDGLWFLQQLSPGFAPLMPFMLAKNDLTISQLWSEKTIMGNLLPAGDAEFGEDVVDAIITETEE
jgi:hypothetical protein